MFSRLRSFIRAWFTRAVLACEEPLAAAKDTTRKPKARNRRYRSVPPSERFVWAMVLLVVALVGLIALEAVFIVVTGTVNGEMIAAITGLVGSLVTAFFMGKKT